jgi:hypothetical protein
MIDLSKLTPAPWQCLDCGPVNIERPKKKPILVHEVTDAPAGLAHGAVCHRQA